MRWGRLWGKRISDGMTIGTRWGAEDTDVSSGRQEVRKVRGRIIPCDSCKRVATCAMYQSFTRHRLRHGEYSQGTNILHLCTIYQNNRAPGDLRSHTIHGRTRGNEPT